MNYPNLVFQVGQVAVPILAWCGVLAVLWAACEVSARILRRILLHLKLWGTFNNFIKARHEFEPWLLNERKRLGMNPDGTWPKNPEQA